jgi:hypothetical protein
MATAEAQFEALRGLHENWDGYGAAVPGAEIISLAQAIARLIEIGLRRPLSDSPVLHVSPTRIGGVLIEWENQTMEHEIEINPDASFGFLHRNKATGQIDTRKISPFPLQLDFLQELQQLLAA